MRRKKGQGEPSQAFYSLAESFPDSFIQYDIDGRILYLNNHLAKKLGVTLSQVSGRFPSEIWPDGRFNAIDNAVRQTVADGKAGKIEFWQAIDTPDQHYHQIHIVPERDFSGKMVGVFAFGYDLTRLKSYGRFLRTLINTLPDLVWAKDKQGVYSMCNDRFEKFFGASESEIIGKTDYDFVAKPVADEFRRHDRITMETDAACTNEEWITFTDGHRELVETIKVPIHDNLGQVTGVLGIARDITERAENDLMLRQREEEFRSLAENSPDNIVRYDCRCRRIYANQRAQEVFLSLSGRNHAGETPNESHPDGSFEKYENVLKKVINTGGVEDFEIVVRDKKSGPRCHMIRMAAEKNDAGEIVGALAFGRDITQIRERERRLYLLEYAMERMVDGSVLVSRNGRILDVNRAMCTMLGYEKDELFGKALFDIAPDLTPENWNSHWKKIEDAGGVLQFETHNLSRDGQHIPTEISCSLFNFENKEYNLAIVRNITERKQNEEQLRMAASVFDAAREGITITDPEGRILDINPAFSAITGYTKEDVIGKRPNILSSGKHEVSFYEEMWGELAKDGTWTGEIINRRKNGELFSERLDINAVKDKSGKLKYYIGIFSDISQVKEHEKHLQHIAHHDTLTGLPNRLLLTDRLSVAISQARRTGNILAIFYLDLDNFKPINDNYGHDFGDRVLIEVGQRISANLRESDTVARIGGDEFIILLSGISDIDECEFTAHRLLMMISRPIVIDGHTLRLTGSIGISLFPNDNQDDADILLRYADQAMYYAKSGGRNHFVFFDSYLQENVNEQNQTIHDLRNALNENQITVYYQPIIDLSTMQTVKAEALVRWCHPSLGMIPPSDFIPVAENGGLIHEIGDLVFKEAARVAQTWNKEKINKAGGRVRISINRSPRQFFKSNSVHDWRNYLSERNIPGDLIVVEITEGLLLDDRPDVHEQLNQLRDMGATVSLDDFGTGYSSLSYLKKFKIDYLKIDRSFIRDICEDPDDLAIVESIIAMANRLGIKVVAEGVETKEQAVLLKDAGCDLAQGYYFARPMPEEKFLAFVKLQHFETGG